MSEDSSKLGAGKLPWGVISAGVMVIVCFKVMPYVASFFLVMIPRLFGTDGVRLDEWLLTPAANFVYVALSSIFAGAALYWFISYKKVSLRQAIGLDRPRWSYLLYAVGGFLLYFLLFVMVVTLTRALLPIDTEKEQALGFSHDVGGLGLVLAFVGLVVIPPIIEESVFRGFMYGTFRSSRVNAWLSAVLVSALFGFLHLSGSGDGSALWIAGIDTFVLSMVLCFLREKLQSIWICMLIHALKNGVVFVNLFLLGST